MRKHLLRFLLIVMIVCFGVGIMAACGDDTEGENPNPDEAATYTLTYKANGGVGNDKTEQHKEGDTVTVLGADTFTYEGHTFTKWKEEGGSAEYNPGATFTMPGRNVTLAAQWQANGTTEAEYEIKVTDPTGKAQVEFDKEGPYHKGDVVRFTVDFAPGENLRVVSVKADGVELQKGEDGKYTVTVAEKDIEITIESEPMGEHEFNVSLSVTGGGNGNSATLDKEGTVGKDEKVTLTVVTAEGYTAEVKLNGNPVNLNAQGKYELTVTADAAFTVTFTQNSTVTQEYTVSLNVTGVGNGNSAELDKTGKVAKDTKVTLTVVTASGYSVEVKLNGNHVDLNGQGKYEHTVTADAAFTVTFTKNDEPGPGPSEKDLTAFHNAGMSADGSDIQLVLRFNATGYADAEALKGDLKVAVGGVEVAPYEVNFSADGANTAYFHIPVANLTIESGSSAEVTLKSTAAEKTYDVPATSVDSAQSTAVFGGDTYTLKLEGGKLVIACTKQSVTPGPGDKALSDFGVSDIIAHGTEGVRIVLRFKATGYDTETIKSDITIKINHVSVAVNEVTGNAETGYIVYFLLKADQIANLGNEAYKITLVAEEEITGISTGTTVQNNAEFGGRVFTLSVAENELTLTIAATSTESTVNVTVSGKPADVQGEGYELKNGNDAVTSGGKVPTDATLTLTVTVPEGYKATVNVVGASLEAGDNNTYTIKSLTGTVTITITYAEEGEEPGPSAKELTAFHNAGIVKDGSDIQLILRFSATGYANADELKGDLKVAVGGVEVEPYLVTFSNDGGAHTAYFHIPVADLTIESGSSAEVTLKSTAAAKTYDVPATSVDATQSTADFDGNVYTLAYEGEKLVLKYTAKVPVPADEIEGVWTVESDEGTVTLYIKKSGDGIDVAEVIQGDGYEIGASVHIPAKDDHTYGFESGDSSTTISVVDGTLTFTAGGQEYTSTSKEALPADITLPSGVYENAEKTVTLTLGAQSTLVRDGETQTVTAAVVGDYILLLAKHEGNAEGVMAGSLAKQESDGSLTLYVGEESFKLTKQTGEEPERSAYNFHDAELWTDGLNVTLNMWFDTTGYTKAQLNDACTLTVNGVTCARYNAGDVLDNGGTLRWFLLNDLTAVADAKVCVVIDGDSYDVKVSTISDGNKTKEFKNKTYTIAKDADGNLTLTVENLPEDPTKVPKASGDADAQNYPDKWSVYDPDGKATAKYEDETLKFSWTDRGGQVWWAVQLYYVDSRLSVGDKYTVSFTVTAKFEITAEKPLILRFFEGDAFAADITITAQDTPVSFQSAEATLNGNKQAIKMFICARDAAENDRYGSGSIEISNLEVTPVEMTTLETPSISFEGNTYTITDSNGEGVKEYQVGLYKGDEAYHTFTVATTAMTGTLDVSSMANGEYTVKVMAVAAEGHFRSSGWSEGVSYTVSNSEPRSYQLPYSEEKDMPVDEWVYWTDNNNDDNNIVPTENTYNNGTVTLQFHHNTNGPEYHWHTQLFYRNPELNGTDHTFLMYIESTASGKITVNGKAVELIEGQKVKVYGNFAEGRAHITIQFAVWGEAENSAIQEGKITITDIQFDVSEAEPEKPTFTFVKGEGAEGEDPRLEAEDPNDRGSYTVNLPQNPYTAPEGKYFRGWQINDTVYFPEEAYDAEAGATITVTAVWEDLYVSYDQSVTLSHTWTNPVNVVVTNGAPAIELTATVSDTTPTDWHGILVDINMTIKGASASDFIRLRLDGYIFTFNDDTTNTANIGTDVSKWNATSYTSLFANGGKAVQRVTASLNGRILTYTIATYAEGTTDFSTAEPVVSVTYTVESAVDVDSLTLAFYYDDGATGAMSFTDAKVKASVRVSDQQSASVEEPLTWNVSKAYVNNIWHTEIRKGEKLELNGTVKFDRVSDQGAFAPAVWDGPVLSLYTNAPLERMRVDNYMVDGTGSAAAGWDTKNGLHCVNAQSGTGSYSQYVENQEYNFKVTLDWTGDSIVYTIVIGDNLVVSTWTVTATGGALQDSYFACFGGDNAVMTFTSMTRSHAAQA